MQEKQVARWRWATMGIALGAGVALGLVGSGFPERAWKGLLFGAALAWPLSWLVVKLNRHPSPLTPVRGIRWLALLAYMLLAGMAVGYLPPGLTPRTPHHPLIPDRLHLNFACMTVAFTIFGIWWLSWPKSQPEYGRQRGAGYVFILLAALHGWTWVSMVRMAR